MRKDSGRCAMIVPVQLIAEILGASGFTTTIVASLKQWLENKRSKPKVTVTMSSSDGRQVELSGEEIRSLTAKQLRNWFGILEPKLRRTKLPRRAQTQ